MTNPHEAALEAAARAMAHFNGDYEGPELQWGAYAEDFRVGFQAYLTSMREAGRVMVPVEATQAMIAAAWRREPKHQNPTEAYRPMIAAAQEGE